MSLVGGVTNALHEKINGPSSQGKEEDSDPDLRWKLVEYRRGCGGMMGVGRLIAVAVDGDNPVIYDQNDF